MAEEERKDPVSKGEELKQYTEAVNKFCSLGENITRYEKMGVTSADLKSMMLASFHGLKPGETPDIRMNLDFTEIMYNLEIQNLYDKKAKADLVANKAEKEGNEKLPLFEDLKKIVLFPKDIFKAIMTGEYNPEEEKKNKGRPNKTEEDRAIAAAEKRLAKFLRYRRNLERSMAEKGTPEVIPEFKDDEEVRDSDITTEDAIDATKKSTPYAKVGVVLGSLESILQTSKNIPEELRGKINKAIELMRAKDVEEALKVAAQIEQELAKYNIELERHNDDPQPQTTDQGKSELENPTVDPTVTPTVQEQQEGPTAETSKTPKVEEPSVEGRKVVGSDVSKNQTEMDKLVKEFETLDFSDTTAAMIWIADYARLSSNGAKVPENIRKDMVQKFEENGYPSNTSYKLPRYIDLTEKGRAAYIMTCASRLIGGNGVIDEKTVGIEAEAIVLKRAPDKALPDEVLGVESYDPNKQGVDRNKQSDVDKILQEQIDKLMQEVDSVDFSNPDQALAWMTKFGKLASQMEAPADIDKAKLNDIFKESGINTREGAAKLYSPNTKNLAEAELWAVTIGAGRILQDGQFPNTNAMNRILEAKGIIEPAKGETTQNVETPTAEGPTVENAVPAQEPEELPEQGKNAVKKIATETFEHGYSDKDGRRITEEMRRDLHPELVEQLEAEEKRRQQEQEEFDEHDPMSKYANGR